MAYLEMSVVSDLVARPLPRHNRRHLPGICAAVVGAGEAQSMSIVSEQINRLLAP